MVELDDDVAQVNVDDAKVVPPKTPSTNHNLVFCQNYNRITGSVEYDDM